MSVTRIEWADLTINPVVGCSKCSDGCQNCYAERFAARLAKNPATAAKYAGVVDEARKWTGKVSALDLSVFESLPKKGKRVFVGSMTDIFHRETSFEDLRMLWKHMAFLRHHTFMILTKRPERMYAFIEDNAPVPLENVWIGVTVCNQKEADEKIPVLIQTPAAKRFVSVEPMLDKILFTLEDLTGQTWDTLLGGIYSESANLGISTGFQPTPHLDWVICGGETGPNARPMHPDWVRCLRDQCRLAGVPFFFKKFGKFQLDVNGTNALWPTPKEYERMLDGREWNEVPQ